MKWSPSRWVTPSRESGPASSTATCVQVSPPSSVRTNEPPWPTATPTLSSLNASPGQLSRDRGLHALPGLAAVVGDQGEAAFANGDEPVAGLGDVHQQYPVTAHVDDDSGARLCRGSLVFAARRRGEATEVAPSNATGNSCPIASCSISPAAGLPPAAKTAGPGGTGAGHRQLKRGNSPPYALTWYRCDAARPAGNRTTCPSGSSPTAS